MSDAPVPPAVPGDDKDWTWVLDRPCPECGFDAATVEATAVADMTRMSVTEWQRVLERPDVSVRPEATTWSPLEYASHVRDVFRVYLGRLDRMLTEDGPRYANWNQDVTAVDERYDQASATVVGLELAVAGEAIAERFDGVQGDQWTRTGFRSDDATFTVDSIARYFVHDIVHHLWDVDAGRGPSS